MGNSSLDWFVFLYFIVIKQIVYVYVCVLFYRVFPVEQIPLESSSLTTWLDQLYVTKDNILQEFYQTGRFGRAQGNSSAKYETNPKSVYFSTSLIIALHIVIPIIFALEVTCFLYIIHMSCFLMMSVCLKLL